MIAAIMQPYFFPYIGYFQLMKAVDTFVIYDDAQYIKGGWINRNRILTNGKPCWLTLPVSRASLTLSINQRHYLLDDDAIGAIKRRLQTSYAKAPAYDEIFPIVCELLDYGNSNVADFNTNLLKKLATRLGITCKFIVSSEIDKSTTLRGEAKVIDLCHRIRARHYINAIGGKDLYHKSRFEEARLRLSFLQTTAKQVQLDSGPQHMSVIESLMSAGVAGCSNMLCSYELIEGVL